MDHLQDNDLLTQGINEETKSNLSSIAQWTNINAIVGFVNLAVSVISTVMAIGKMSRYGSSGGAGSVFTLAVTVSISLLLNITLLNAAKNIKAGLAATDQGTFNFGLAKLASYMKIVGTLFIIGLILFGLVFLIALAAGGSRGFRM